MSRITFGLILILVTGASVFFWILPRWDSVKTLRTEVQSLGELRIELTRLGEKRDVMMAQYNAISEDERGKLSAIAPEGPETGSALVGLEALAEQNGVVLKQIDFSKSAGESSSGRLELGGVKTYTTLPVSLSIEGTYSAFRTFLTALEWNLRLFDVTKITFSGDPLKTMSVSLSGNMYYRK